MKNMKHIITVLDEALANLEVLSMSGKAVDIMAAAKCKIYEAQDIAREHIEVESKELTKNADYAQSAACCAEGVETYA